MHIGLCAGPCINGDGYADRAKAVRRVLNGDAALCWRNWLPTWKRRRRPRLSNWPPSIGT